MYGVPIALCDRSQIGCVRLQKDISNDCMPFTALLSHLERHVPLLSLGSCRYSFHPMKTADVAMDKYYLPVFLSFLFCFLFFFPGQKNRRSETEQNSSFGFVDPLQ